MDTPQKRGRFLHTKSTNFVHLLQRSSAGRKPEGIVPSVMSTDIAFEDTLVDQDSGSMIVQSNIGVTNSSVDRALVLKKEHLFTGKGSMLCCSQRLCRGSVEV